MIFADTSFWVATCVQNDKHHPTAVALLHAVGSQVLATTNHVVGESWTFLRARAGHHVAVGFLDMIDKSKRLRMIHVSEPDERASLRWLRRHDERRYSFVDATSFAVMKAHKIRQALAFDGDFAAAGFIELRP